MCEQLRLGLAHDDGWRENDPSPSFQRHQIARVLFSFCWLMIWSTSWPLDTC